MLRCPPRPSAGPSSHATCSTEPDEIDFFAGRIGSESLSSWTLEPRHPNWAAKLARVWERGEAGAQARLDAFLDADLAHYAARRDRPDLGATTRLSPHLHFGELSPRQIWHAVRGRASARGGSESTASALLRQLGWREFSYHLLHQ
jgi:deoxyribodipyrimidine photo-lyase